MSAEYYKLGWSDKLPIPTFWKVEDNKFTGVTTQGLGFWLPSSLSADDIAEQLSDGTLVPATAEEAEPPTPEATRTN